MKKLAFVFAAMLSAGVSAQSFQTTTSTALLGDQQVVTLEKVNTLNLAGPALKVGDIMPSAILATSDLKPFDTSKTAGKARVYNVVVSVDTPVCVQQSVEMSEFVKKNAAKLKNVEFLAVSADTPFAQQRFIKENNLSGLVFLSDSKDHELGKKTGTHIKELGLMTRTIIVTDKNNKIVHIQRVPELTTIPSLEAAVEIALKQA